jgi:hypothetical protein
MEAGSTLRYSRRRPFGINPIPNILSQALAPLQSFTSTSPQNAVATRWLPAFAPSEVSSPSAFLHREEPHTPAVSHDSGYVASSGFPTLSTPCSLRDLPGLFHPGSALGVHPTRPCSFRGAVRPFERRAPQGFPSPLLTGKPTTRIPSGTLTPQKARNQMPVFTRQPEPNASLGFSAPRLLARNRCGEQLLLHVPSHASVISSQAGDIAGVPGFLLSQTQPISLEINVPPCSFPPRYSSRLFGSSVKLGYEFPLEVDTRRRGS